MELVEVGKIINTHGLKGEVKVLPFSDDPTRFKMYQNVMIRSSFGDFDYPISSVKIIKKTAVLGLVGLNDIEAAEKLKGSRVFVLENEVPVLPEDAFYVKDLIGCVVKDEMIGLLGVLQDVIFTGSNDVYVVNREEKRDLLIPALKSVILDINLLERVITTHLPAGLFEIYED
ncbi:MAG: ribosome maturation factor RimM [Clostridia bacterium]